VDAPHGHDSILIEVDRLNQLVRDWIAEEVYQEARCHAA